MLHGYGFRLEGSGGLNVTTTIFGSGWVTRPENRASFFGPTATLPRDCTWLLLPSCLIQRALKSRLIS
jgi:hypothetical protein